MDRKNIIFFILGIFAGILLSLSLFFVFPSASAFGSAPVIVSVFSPNADKDIISLIDGAEKTLDIEMYVFTSKDVVAALQRAHDRGVRIRFVLEKRVIDDDNQKNYELLRNYGIEIRWASRSYRLTHSKFMIIDGKRVVVGSHNFTNSALKYNREASVVISDTKTTSDFQRVFDEDWYKV